MSSIVSVLTASEDSSIISDVVCDAVVMFCGVEERIAASYVSEETMAVAQDLEAPENYRTYVCIVDDLPKFTKACGIHGIPAIGIFKDGKIQASGVGMAALDQYQAFLDAGGVMPCEI